MAKKIALTAVLVWLIAWGGALAGPMTGVIATYSSATWLPADIDQAACETVDRYLVSRFDAIFFNGAKSPDKQELARRIGQWGCDSVIVIRLTGFYDPPYTKAHLGSDVKASDTVATVLAEYSVYNAAGDNWVVGRLYQRAVYPDAEVPLAAAYPEVVNRLLPRLADKLAQVVK